MLEYLIYAILIFLPLGFLMARFLLKQGFAKKQITGFTIAALAAVILFPIGAARMGTTSTGIIFIFILALFSWQIVKTEQLSTNEELNENSQFDPAVLIRREESNKPVETAMEETTARSEQETVYVAEEAVVAISEPEMDTPGLVAVDLSEQETADVAEEEIIDIISEPKIDVPDEETIDLAEKEIERPGTQITGPVTIDAEEDRSQMALTHGAPAKMADDTENSSDPTSIEPGLSDQIVNFDANSIEPNETTDDSSEREETRPVQETVTAEAVVINDSEPEEKSPDADSLIEFPDERDDMDDTPAVNSMIDAGFENKINGNMQEAISCFKAALQLTDSADLKYLLSQELVLHYEILGQYTNAINVLHNIIGSGLVSTAGLDQAQQKLEYFNRMIEELERLGIGEVPVSEVPRLVKIKVGQNT
jgi:hypothetical protein